MNWNEVTLIKIYRDSKWLKRALMGELSFIFVLLSICFYTLFTGIRLRMETVNFSVNILIFLSCRRENVVRDRVG